MERDAGDPRFDVAAARTRARRATALAVAALLLLVGVAVGLLADAERAPLPQETFPTWRIVVGAVAAVTGAAALVVGVVAALRADVLGAWSRSPLRTLGPAARQEVVRQVRGEEPVPPGGLARACAAAEPTSRTGALVTLHAGALLSALAQAFLATSAVVVLVCGFGALLLLWALPLVVRASTRARRFLDDHPLV